MLPRATMRFAVGVHASLHYFECALGSKLRGVIWVAREARSLHLLTQRPAESMEIYSLRPQSMSNNCVNVNDWQYSSVLDSKWTQKWNGLYLVLLEQMFCFIRLGHAVNSFECVFMQGLQFLILTGLILSPQCSFRYSIFLILNLSENPFFR